MGNVDLKYLWTVKGRSRKYCYYRRGRKRIPLTDTKGRKLGPNDPGLAAAWDRVHKGYESRLPKQGPIPGTLGYLIAEYLEDDAFTKRAPRTQKDYKKVTDYLKDAGDMPLELLNTPAVVEIRDQANEDHGWKFSKDTRALVSRLWNWGALRGYTKGENPAKPVPNLERPKHLKDANRPWEPDELKAVLAALPPGLRAATALGAYAGLREGDALKLPWSAIKDGWIVFKVGKTGRELEIPVSKALDAILAETPRNSPIIVTGKRGKPLTDNGFRAMFFRVINKLEEVGQVGSGLTFHGLRHTAGTDLAEAGADDRGIQDFLGHSDRRMTQRYTDRANKRASTKAAVDKLEQAANKKCKPPV